MSLTKKTWLVIAIICIAVVGCFYYVLTDKRRIITNTEPYVQVINTTLTSVQDAVLVDNNSLQFTKEYPKELQVLDSMYISQPSDIKVPKGSSFKFLEALKITGSASGLTNSYLLGEVYIAASGKSFPIIYNWGSLKTLCISEPCNYWEFKLAPWQKEKDRLMYFEK